jgi:hypothetical protein
MDFTWLIPYTTGLLKVESAVFKYISQRKDNRQWLGMMESLISLAYLRFRPGAKLHVNGFKIDNDHSHQISFKEYNIDLQGVKRTILGGSSIDLLNLKSPLYFSYQILNSLDKDDQEILLTLAEESIKYLMEDTYKYDLTAQEYLRGIQILIEKMIDVMLHDKGTLPNKETENYLCIKKDYYEHPFTKENLKIWNNNIPILKDICHQFRQAKDKYMSGGSYENNLENIKHNENRIIDLMRTYATGLEKI